MRHRLSRRAAPRTAIAVGAVSVIPSAFLGFVPGEPAAAASPDDPTYGLLAQMGIIEISAIAGIVLFMMIIGFFLFWGGPPGGGRR